MDPWLTRFRIPASGELDVNAVTVRRLLSHCSGLSLLPASESFEYPPSLEETLSRNHGAFGRLRLLREPGSGFEYHNGNYLVLSLLIEELTGEDFATYATERILRPLGMDDSSYALDPDRLATPHDEAGRALPHDHQPSFAASGGLYTTAIDLARLVAAAMSGPEGPSPGRGVLTPGAVSVLTSPAEEAGGRYGLRYKILPVTEELTLIGHEGTNPGWRATFMAEPERQVGILVLTNSDAGSALVADIVCTWADWETQVELEGLCDGDVPISAR